MLLVTKDCIGYMPFDDSGNDWESSDLRAWLNSGFLADFYRCRKGENNACDK